MIRDYYKAKAKDYDKLWEQYTAATLSKAMTCLPTSLNGLQILDYGCGTGELLSKLIEYDPNFGKLVGYDPSDEMLQQAERKLEKVDAEIRKKIELFNSINFSNKFDLITTTNAFHYFEDPEEVLLFFRENLKKQGLLIIVDYTKESFPAKYFEWFIKFMDKAHQRAFYEEEITKLVGNAGFDLISAEKFQISQLWKGASVKAKVS